MYAIEIGNCTLGEEMAIQRSASRRRLVLFNDRGDENEATKRTEPTEKEAAPLYTRRAHPRWLPTAAVLAPGSWWKLALCWLLGAGCIAGLLALHSYHEQWEATLGAGVLDSFDLAQRGNLAAWFVSMFMAWGAILSMVVYSVRKHRVDDYRGGYRVWITTALAFVASALIMTTGLLGPLSVTLQHFTQWPAETNAWLWSVMVFGPLSGGLVLRMALEIRESRLASFSLGAAVICIAAGSAVSAGWLSPQSIDPQLASSGLLLAGYFHLVFACASYSRFVLLDAQGMITRPVAAPTAVEEEYAEESADEADADPPTLRVAQVDEEQEEETPRPKSRKSKRKKQAAKQSGDPEDEETDTDGDPAPSEGLSKAERRRQRRLKRRDRRSAA